LGLVGETGAGKTTTALGIMGLVDCPPGRIHSGEIIYKGQNLLEIGEDEYLKIRGKEISMIFQDPMTALNPVMTVVDQIAEVLENHRKIDRKEAKQRAIDMLKVVRIPPERADEYPHQFSGGMKQRVVIAIALACNPSLLIADEPTTALDVTIQAQVLEMMKDLRREFNTSMIMITHDFGIVAETCNRVAIMYAGEIVESGTLRDIFKDAKHPYTIGLFGAIPNPDADTEFLYQIEGLMPDPMDLPSGCPFSPRCTYAEKLCHERNPDKTLLSGEEHTVKCHICAGSLKTKEAGMENLRDE
jgi:peptide/nickel transport system ATP-binding protein